VAGTQEGTRTAEAFVDGQVQVLVPTEACTKGPVRHCLQAASADILEGARDEERPQPALPPRPVTVVEGSSEVVAEPELVPLPGFVVDDARSLHPSTVAARRS
jgi:hypothetical protein